MEHHTGNAVVIKTIDFFVMVQARKFRHLFTPSLVFNRKISHLNRSADRKVVGSQPERILFKGLCHHHTKHLLRL